MTSNANIHSSQINYSIENVYFDSEKYISGIIEGVQNTKKSVYCEFYIATLDDRTRPLFNELNLKSSEGVSVFTVFDSIGSFQLRDRLLNLKFSYYFYGLLKWLPHSFQTNHFYMWLQKLKSINRRTHRKIVILDNEYVFLGSANLIQNNWRETGLLLKFQPDSQHYVRELSRKLFRSPRLKLSPHSPFRTNTTFRERKQVYRDYLTRIKNAKKRIFINTAYFLPKRALLKELISASRRHVDVKVCLPHKSDVKIVQWASLELYQQLLKNNIKVYEYQPTMMHAKSIIIDDTFIVGSANLNHRSFLHDLEIEFISSDKKTLEQLLNQWHKDIKNCLFITLLDLKKITFIQRLLSKFFFNLRYWL